jgi:two-component system chemotaxis response regulator CheB
MSETRVLVVDDSRMMRTLITSALEEIRNITVVGEADGADEAREKIAQLHPDVLTLDVEMPGMSGIAFLEEIMTTRPLPVIMFSTRTTEGTGDTAEAKRLGAIGCFPKPVGPPDMMKKVIEDVAKCIKTAREAELTKAAAAKDDGPVPPIDWNGRPLLIGCDSSGLDALKGFLTRLPDNCPPTLVALQNMDMGAIYALLGELSGKVKPALEIASDGTTLAQGKIYFSPGADKHVVLDSWPGGHCRLMERDPVGGVRPSASLLFASAAKAAGEEAVGVVFGTGDEDGERAASVLGEARSHAFNATDDGYRLKRGEAVQAVSASQLAIEVMRACGK